MITSISNSINNDYLAIQKTLRAIIAKNNHAPQLYQSMQYSLNAPSKLFRPLLLSAIARLYGVKNSQYNYCACAIEAIHCFSLIHDDLPAMDNSDIRRGQKSNHKQFDEATAVLAGDALQALAFAIINQKKCSPDPAKRSLLTAILAKAAGISGMCGGQMLDINSDLGTSKTSMQLMQSLKTGALIRAACLMGVVLGGGTRKDASMIDYYAKNLGLAFQYYDDYLDLTGCSSTLGKPIRQDQQRNKSSATNYYNELQLKTKSQELITMANKKISDYFNQTDFNNEALTDLQKLADFSIDRNS